MNIELAYLAVEVTDVEGVAAVLGGVAGMIPGASTDSASTWRNDDRAQRILVAEGPYDSISMWGHQPVTREA